MAMRGFSVRVQLLQIVGQMDNGNNSEHHTLVAGGQVVQGLLGLPAQLLQLIGNCCREIIVGVLLLLPAGNIRFHGQDAALDFLYCLVRRDRENVDGQHEVAREVA